MQTQFIFLFGLAIILTCAITRAHARSKPAWSQHLQGWRKLFGVIAFVLTLLIIINPEFLALGLLGDAAFFDMLVLALSLQLHMVAVHVGRGCVTVLARSVRWIGIPSPGLRYLLAVAALALGSVASIWRKAAHRISSSLAMA